MEGPSLYLSAQWLAPFIGKRILGVEGNTKMGKERLNGKKLLDIFSWGKHLVFQFQGFAMRVHFMLFGSFQATLKDVKITGDYNKEKVNPRLVLTFDEGQITFYSCSLKYIEASQAKDLYDFSTDIMSPQWDAKKALKAVKSYQNEEIADVLLDQTIFSGVGNIIKNEVLFLVKKQPTNHIKDLSNPLLQKIVKTTKEFSLQFYEWRKQFVLRKHYKIYKKKLCTVCGEKVVREKTGKKKRTSYFCPNCQK